MEDSSLKEYLKEGLKMATANNILKMETFMTEIM